MNAIAGVLSTALTYAWQGKGGGPAPAGGIPSRVGPSLVASLKWGYLVGCSMYVLVGGYRWTNTGMRENQNDIVKRLSGALGEHSDASLVKLLNSELLAVPATGDWRRCHRLRIGWIEAIQARFNDKRTDATIVAYSPWLSSRGMRRLHAQWERCGDALKSLERCLPSPSSSF